MLFFFFLSLRKLLKMDHVGEYIDEYQISGKNIMDNMEYSHDQGTFFCFDVKLIFSPLALCAQSFYFNFYSFLFQYMFIYFNLVKELMPAWLTSAMDCLIRCKFFLF